MDVVQLKTLIHVAELGSLSKAADRLRIAQPALSRQIRLLEDELGTALFTRHGRGMVMTQAGQDVLEHAVRILKEIEAIHISAGGKRDQLDGLLSIGMTPTIAQIVTVPLVQTLRSQAPQLSLRFNAAFSGYLIDWLQRGALDVAFSYDPQPAHSLRTRPVMMESFILVGDRKSKLSLKKPVAFQHLADLNLILPSAPHGLRAIVDTCARQAGFALHTTIEVDSFSSMIDLVRNGFGFTVLPLAATYELIQQKALCGAPLVDPVPERKVVLVYPADRPVRPAARFAGDCFAAIAADLIRRNIWRGRLIAAEG